MKGHSSRGIKKRGNRDTDGQSSVRLHKRPCLCRESTELPLTQKSTQPTCLLAEGLTRCPGEGIRLRQGHQPASLYCHDHEMSSCEFWNASNAFGIRSTVDFRASSTVQCEAPSCPRTLRRRAGQPVRRAALKRLCAGVAGSSAIASGPHRRPAEAGTLRTASAGPLRQISIRSVVRA